MDELNKLICDFTINEDVKKFNKKLDELKKRLKTNLNEENNEDLLIIQYLQNKNKLSKNIKKYEENKKYKEMKEEKDEKGNKKYFNKYYYNNKDKIIKQCKQYRQNNKEKINEYNKQYRQKMKDLKI